MYDNSELRLLDIEKDSKEKIVDMPKDSTQGG